MRTQLPTHQSVTQGQHASPTGNLSELSAPNQKQHSRLENLTGFQGWGFFSHPHPEKV